MKKAQQIDNVIGSQRKRLLFNTETMRTLTGKQLGGIYAGDGEPATPGCGSFTCSPTV